MATFKKGDLVTKISHWSSADASFTVRDAVVYSCGKKQMVLTDAETGEEMGRNYRPQIAQSGLDVVVPRMPVGEALDLAERLSAMWIEEEIARKNKTLAHYGDSASDGYVRAMRSDIEKLEAQRERGGLAHRYADAHQRIIDAVARRTA